MSTEMTKGDAWFAALSGALESTRVGVVFITSDNQHETWLNFESGALLTKLDKQRLCPVLVGLKKADYDGPLKNLQLTEFDDQDDMRRLMRDINAECEEPLAEPFLDAEFDLRWEELQTKSTRGFDALETPPKPVATPAGRSTDEKIDELLELVRESQASTSVLHETTRALLDREKIREKSDRHAPQPESSPSPWETKYALRNGVLLGKVVVARSISTDKGKVSYADEKTGKISTVPLDSVTISNAPF